MRAENKMTNPDHDVNLLATSKSAENTLKSGSTHPSENEPSVYGPHDNEGYAGRSAHFEQQQQESDVSPPPPLLNEVPAILQRSDRDVAVRAFATGIPAGLAIGLACFFASPTGNMIAKMFDPRDLGAFISYGILIMFFWTMNISYARWQRIRALTQISSSNLLADAVDRVRATGILMLVRSTDNEPAKISPLLRRLHLVAKQWAISADLQDAEVVLTNEVALCAEASSRAYSIARVVVWSLPVLGLVGTVLGIAQAVGGFALFLGQDISDVAQIRNRLVDVTGGLSFAFSITLLGLLTSLIVMLLVTPIQNAEDRLFASVQKGIVESFLPVLQEVAPAAKDDLIEPARRLEEALERWIGTVLDRADTILNGFATKSTAAVQKIEGVIDAGTDTVNQNILQAKADVVAFSTGVMENVAGTAAAAQKHVTEINAETVRQIAEIRVETLRQIAAIQEGTASTVGEITAAAELRMNSTREANEKYALALSTAIEDSVSSIATAAEQRLLTFMIAAETKANEISNELTNTVSTTAQEAIDAVKDERLLHTTELLRAVSDLITQANEAIGKLKITLDEMRKPLVLQLMRRDE
jgi:biopolymer transport protein ExbB/TolQ